MQSYANINEKENLRATDNMSLGTPLEYSINKQTQVLFLQSFSTFQWMQLSTFNLMLNDNNKGIKQKLCRKMLPGVKQAYMINVKL